MSLFSLTSVSCIILLIAVVLLLLCLLLFSRNADNNERFIPIQPLYIEIPPGLPNKNSSQGFISYQNLYNKETLCPSPPGTKCKVLNGEDKTCKVAEVCMHYVGEEEGTCVCSIMNKCMEDAVC